MSEYIINEWALIRRNEMVVVPDKFDIHPDFLKVIEKDEFESAFRQIWNMFYQIYSDIARDPGRFSMPMYRSAEYHYGSKEAGQSRGAAWKPFYLLLFLFSCGEMRENRFTVNVDSFRQINKISSPHKLMTPLCDYGFVFTGLKNGKIMPGMHSLEIDYPDNRHVLTVLELVAKKVVKTQELRGWNHFGNSFISWNYRILQDGLTTANVGFEADYVADRMHNAADREFAFAFHRIMKETGYFHERGGWNEGPDICYYDSRAVMERKGPYIFRLVSWKSDLRLMLRIRNAEKCLEYVDTCSGDIKKMFRHSDLGCQNRKNGTCTKGVRYTYDGEERWHCGCCCAAFQLHPAEEDIPGYLKLVELGVKK